MKTTTHTPGEWVLERYSVSGIATAFRVRLPNGFCAFTSAGDPDQEGNARLIATSPALLAGLERLAYEAERRAGVPKAVIAEARSIIAKARGQ